MIESAIFTSFCHLQITMLGVQRAWADCRRASDLDHALSDARHHCCYAASFLAGFERDDACDVYERLSDVERMVAHEAYISVIALGQVMRSALEDRLPGTTEIARALAAIGALLDTIERFASRADVALRAVVIASPGPAGARSTPEGSAESIDDEPVESFIEPRRAS